MPESSIQACPELVDGDGKHRFTARLVDSAFSVAPLRLCVRQKNFAHLRSHAALRGKQKEGLTQRRNVKE